MKQKSNQSIVFLLQLQMRLQIARPEYGFRNLRTCYLNKYQSTKKHGGLSFQQKQKSGKVEIYDRTSLQQWYNTSLNYWQKAEASDTGMLMGRLDLHNIDINFSSQFFDSFALKSKNLKTTTVLDCGAGIGRIGESILKTRFKDIDMVQKCQHFVKKAKESKGENNYRHFYCCGLQSFTFQHRYDCIWVQWVLTHLPDQHTLQFLTKAKQSLQASGIIIVKQNYATSKQLIDKEDSSITRTLPQWKQLFHESKLLVLKEQEQISWPSDLYPVRIWALS